MPNQPLQERAAIRAAVHSAIAAGNWTCDDGHKHRRPEAFTLNRLKMEVDRRNPRNLWPSASIGCAIFDLIEAGELIHDDLELRVACA